MICDEAHTALGEKTSACIRAWDGPVFIGMTATGALIARHVADLFPTQTSRFDLAQAARRGVIAPLRCMRIPPGPGVRTIAKVPLRKGEVDQDFDQEELAALLDQEPFNVAIADLYKTRFKDVPGVLYTAGVQHAKNVAKALQNAGIDARAVSGETPKRELAEILAGFERGDVDVLCNAMLLAEGWNSPRATICMHLAPTASRRVYQQRVGRVTRRAPGKEAGLVVDFVHPATTHDETIVTLHSLLDRDVYRGGAIVIGPVRRGRGRRVRVERRVVPVSEDPERRTQVLEREMWRIAVENLDYPERHAWAALAGARVNPQNWRRARAMLQNDRTKELRRRFLLTCIQRNRNSQLRLKALGEIADLRDADAFDDAIDIVGTWSRDDKRAGTKTLLQALVDKRIGRRDQAQAWVWRLASYTRELHEEYAVQRWPETKRLLGLLVNSSGRAHGRNARRLVHAARKQDRRLAVALLAASVSHTPEGEEVLRGARMRMARKPSATARELLRNFPKGGKRSRKRKKSKGGAENGAEAAPDGKALEGGRGRGGRSRPRTGQRLRWTSPAPRATRSPPAVRTSRSPASLTPSATPEPPSQEISRPRSASRSSQADRTSPGSRVDPGARASRRAPSAPPRRRGRDRQRGGRLAQLGRELVGGDREIEADADHRPPVLGPRLDQDPRQLAPVDPDVVRPLDPALDRRRRAASAASQTAIAAASGSSAWRALERADDRRVEEGAARRGGPAPALAAAPRGLLGGGDDGAARGAGLGQLPRPRVGRVGDPEVPVRAAEPHRPLIARRASASSAATRPSMSWRSASASTVSPASRAASLVTGPDRDHPGAVREAAAERLGQVAHRRGGGEGDVVGAAAAASASGAGSSRTVS